MEQNHPTFIVLAPLGQYIRVKRDGNGKLVAADAADADYLGTLNKETFEANKPGSVNLRSNPETKKMVGDDAIADNVPVYRADGGKVTATVQGDQLGLSLNAIGADGEIVTVLEY